MCFLNTLCACSAQPFVSVMTHALLCLTPRSLSVYPQCLCIPMVPVCVSLWSLSVYPHCLCISTVPVCVIPTVYVSSRSLSVYPHCLCVPTVPVCVWPLSLCPHDPCLCVPTVFVSPQGTFCPGAEWRRARVGCSALQTFVQGRGRRTERLYFLSTKVTVLLFCFVSPPFAVCSLL